MDFGGAGVGGLGNAGAEVDVLSWYMGIPVISRLYLTGALLTTAACAVEFTTPYSLYFSWDLVFKGQVWRLITSYLFFGAFSIDFMFHMYFLIRYSRFLEEGEFRGQTAKYLWMLMFGICCISGIAVYTNIPFLGNALTFMMLYVWGRRNESVKMSFFGFLQFNAPYLPWVMLGFSVLMGNPISTDLIGIVVGHVYYFLDFVYPVVADIRGWKMRKIMEPPTVLQWMCGDMPANQWQQ
uniref:Derlin n=1 Tax=Nitzschia sp. IriIs04 TaxID=1444690 RepID=A0A0P0YV63_9STRA|nr:host Der [Nitzschia sp. IriIs04]